MKAEIGSDDVSDQASKGGGEEKPSAEEMGGGEHQDDFGAIAAPLDRSQRLLDQAVEKGTPASSKRTSLMVGELVVCNAD